MKKINNIQDIEIVFESKFINLYKVIYKTFMGNEKYWMVASRKNINEYRKLLFKKENDTSDAVIIVGYDKNKDSLLLIKEYRIPINDYIIALPAGLVDSNESLDVAAIRELKEETGLELYDIDWNKSSKKSFASVGMSDESLAIVFGKVRGELSTECQEESEIIKPFFISRDEAKKIISRNDVNFDTKAWLILNIFANQTLF